MDRLLPSLVHAESRTVDAIHLPGQTGHGPTYRFTRKVNGKTVSETFSSAALLGKAQREVEAFHRFRELSREWGVPSEFSYIEATILIATKSARGAKRIGAVILKAKLKKSKTNVLTVPVNPRNFLHCSGKLQLKSAQFRRVRSLRPQGVGSGWRADAYGI
ncbi:MAG TPA: DUF6788 family protein [Bryobacteraceae bacterium]|nr:DUF6788 family protein [Bryobacteraceae bacterium]